MDEYLYSPVVDALLEWGKTRLLFPGHDEYLMQIRESLFSVAVVDAEKELTSGLSGIIDSVSHSKNALADPALITATPDDAIWTEAERAFFLFDQLVFLREAVVHLLPDYNKGLVKKFLPDLDRILSGISSWLYGSEKFSPLRLTVLNELRKAHLENIPEERRYIFPWYDLFVEHDAPIDWMIDNFDILQESVHGKSIPNETKENINLYVAELNYDRELAHVIEAEFRLSRSIEKIVADNLSVRLFALCKIAATKYLVPEIVEKAGLIGTAYLLISKMPLNTVGNCATLLLQAAFCGPALSDAQRLDAFSWVDRKFKDISSDDFGTNPILDSLKGWSNGKVEDELFAKTLFNSWMDRLLREAKSEKITQVEENKLWDLINSVISMKKREEGYKPQASPEETVEQEAYRALRRTLNNIPRSVSEFFSKYSTQFLSPKKLITVMATVCLVVFVIYGLFESAKIETVAPIGIKLGILAKGDRIMRGADGAAASLGAVVTGMSRLFDKSLFSPTSVEIKKGAPLKSGDEFKIAFELDKDSFVYVLSKDSSGTVRELFSGKLNAKETFSIPKEDWYKLDENVGRETIYVIASEKPIEDMDNSITKLQDSKTGNVKDVFPEVSIEEFYFEHR